MVDYCFLQQQKKVPLRSITRHMLGLYHGQRRARLWRRMLCDPERLERNDPRLLLDALEMVEREARMAA
jgi:tRNA-dihydrouridine synthase A